MENGTTTVYNGGLPTTIQVRSGREYVIYYTDQNGTTSTMKITKSFNAWFIGDFLIPGIGWTIGIIVDVATGNIMKFEEVVKLPISYQLDPEIAFSFVDGIPEEYKNSLTIIGKIE